MSDSRKEFEAHIRATWKVPESYLDWALKLDERGYYQDSRAADQWSGWQAARRAALEEAAKLAAENKLLSHPFGPQFAMGWADAIESCYGAIRALAAQTGQEGK